MARKWWTLIAVSVATFMLLLDITVVNTALPAIEEDLGASFTDLQWVVDAYTLTLAAFVLTAGSLADRLGRRRVFAAGLVIFTLASLLAGLATDPTFLNLARALQGIGGAVMFAVSLALLAQEFEAGKERGHGTRRLRRHDRRGRRHRPAGRRRDRRRPRLGVGLLPERAGRHGRRRGHLPQAARVARPERHERRLGRRRHLQRLAVPARARARARQRGGLGQHPDRLAVRRPRSRCSPPSWSSSARVQRADAAAAPVQAAGLHRRAAGGFRRLRLDVRPVPVPDAVPAELPRAHPVRGGRPLPADHAGELLRGAGGGSPDDAGCSRGCCSASAWPEPARAWPGWRASA